LEQQVKELQATVAMLQKQAADEKAANQPLRDELTASKNREEHLRGIIRKSEAIVAAAMEATSQPGSKPTSQPVEPLWDAFAYPLKLGQRAVLSGAKVKQVISPTEAYIEVFAYADRELSINLHGKAAVSRDDHWKLSYYTIDTIYLSGIPTTGWTDNSSVNFSKVIVEISDTKRTMYGTIFHVKYIEDYTDQATTPHPRPPEVERMQPAQPKPNPPIVKPVIGPKKPR